MIRTYLENKFLKMYLILLLVLFFHVGDWSVVARDVIVETSHGPVRGKLLHEKLNETKGVLVAAFRSIRFAKQPKMFEKPEPPDHNSTLQDATGWPPACVQTPIYTKPKLESEDCLFLSLFAPHKNTAAADKLSQAPKLPVLVFVHGGGFNQGSIAGFGQIGIIRRLVPKATVVVMIQYRLGALGFLSTGDDVAPGNYGLWDMALALEWINKNIGAFGGDKGSVTLMGHSAGAAAVNLLALSPVTQNLFHRLIPFSGAPQAPFCMAQRNPLAATKRIASHLGCLAQRMKNEDHSEQQIRNDFDIRAIVSCIRQKSTAQIVQATLKDLNDQENVALGHEFEVVIDGEFLPTSPEKLYEKSPPKQVMTGVVSVEGGLYTNPLGPFNCKWTYRNMAGFSFDVFDKTMNEAVAGHLNKNPELIREIVKNFYGYSECLKNLSLAYERMTDMFSDRWFVAPAYQNALKWLKAGSSVWLYWFDHYSNNTVPDNHLLKGVYHGGDVDNFVFEKTTTANNEDDELVKDILATYITNFANYGNPMPKTASDNDTDSTVVWEPLSADKSTLRFLRINSEPKMDSNFGGSGAQLWSEILPRIEKAVSETSQTNQTSKPSSSASASNQLNRLNGVATTGGLSFTVLLTFCMCMF